MAKTTSQAAERDEEVDRIERITTQVGIIQEAFGAGNVGVATQGGESLLSGDSLEYLYHEREVLVGDHDLPRLQELVPDGRVVDGLIEGVTLFGLPDGADVRETLDWLDRRLGVGVVTPNHILYVTGGHCGGSGGCCPATEPEPVGGHRTEPVPAQSTDAEFDGTGVVVSVVDTGWYPAAAENPRTPWLADGVSGDEEVLDTLSIRPYGGHGTFVAGIIRCVAPQARVKVEGFLSRGGAITESHMITQLSEALRYGPDIISLSAGAPTRFHRRMLSFEAFWKSQLRHLKGTVLVAAAGNDGCREPFWPAAFPWALSVGALDAAGERADFSNFGSWVDVAARGVDLVNAFPTGTYRYNEPPNAPNVVTFDGLAKWSGTSFSTPIVSGMIAARMSGTGETARLAADSLVRYARSKAQRGVSAWLAPGPDAYSYQRSTE